MLTGLFPLTGQGLGKLKELELVGRSLRVSVNGPGDPGAVPAGAAGAFPEGGQDPGRGCAPRPSGPGPIQDRSVSAARPPTGGSPPGHPSVTRRPAPLHTSQELCALGVRPSVGHTWVHVRGLPMCARVCPACPPAWPRVHLLCACVCPSVRVCMRACVRVCVRVRACVSACMRACLRACVRAGQGRGLLSQAGCAWRCPILGARIPGPQGRGHTGHGAEKRRRLRCSCPSTVPRTHRLGTKESFKADGVPSSGFRGAAVPW